MAQIGQFAPSDITQIGQFAPSDVDSFALPALPLSALGGIPAPIRAAAQYLDEPFSSVGDPGLGGSLADALPHSKADLVAGAVGAALPIAGRAFRMPPSSWVLPTGGVQMLANGENHGNAVVRLLGNTGKAFDPLASGWIRQAGDAIQTGDLRNPQLGKAFEQAAYAAKGGSVIVSHPGGDIEVPVDAASEFLANASAGKYSKPRARSPWAQPTVGDLNQLTK